MRTMLTTAAVLIALPLAAQQPRSKESPLRPEGVKAVVQVTAMDLDVVATRGGQSVPDLTKEEFTVKVDGKAFPLDYFARVDAGTLHGPDLANASPDLILETLQGDGADRFVPRQFLIFFDDDHLLPFERKRVIEGLRDFITRLPTSDRVSILAYGGSSRVLVPYSNSKESLLDGLSKLEGMAPSGLRWRTQFQQTINDVRQSARRSRDPLIRSWSEQVAAREKAVLQDLARAVSALSARSGKRAMIYVSNGLELRPGQSLSQALGTSTLAQFEYSVTDSFRKVVDIANRGGVTIHALDAKGLTTDDIGAENASPSPFDRFFLNQNLTEALSGFAEETGGILVQNRNDFKVAMDQIYRDSASYYSLGVTLTNLDPKKVSHSVSVTCARPGVTVRTRRSYGAKSADEAARDRMEMALMTPDAKGDFPLEMKIGTPKSGGLGRRLAPYEVAVPLSQLTFLDDAGKKKAVVEVSLAAVEDNGDRSSVNTERRTIVVEPGELETALKQVYTYAGEAKTRTGNIRFVATVRDVASDRVGVASTSVRVD